MRSVDDAIGVLRSARRPRGNPVAAHHTTTVSHLVNYTYRGVRGVDVRGRRPVPVGGDALPGAPSWPLGAHVAVGGRCVPTGINVQVNRLMAAAGPVILPVVPIFRSVQRAFVEGVAVGGVK